ncbi:hypothetical protein ABB02_00609 [Clostridiaceae bacterium JG1575]|nr:hypothetical protein ABB02_00609 [Clostridiaceae bacterium JG1575]
MKRANDAPSAPRLLQGGPQEGPPRKDKPKRGRILPFLAVLLTVLSVLALLHLFAPQLPFHQRLSTQPFIAQVLAFPMALGLFFFAGGLGSVLWSVRQKKKGRAQKKLKFYCHALCFLLSALFLFSLTSLGVSGGVKEPLQKEGAKVRLLTWNALHTFDEEIARRIFTQLNVQVAVFPELSLGESEEGPRAGDNPLKAVMERAGLAVDEYDFFESPKPYNVKPVVAIVHRSLGRYESKPVFQTSLGTLHLVPKEGTRGPEILGLHTYPPLPFFEFLWNEDLQRIRDWVQSEGKNAWILGDFNATLRHGALSSLTEHQDALHKVPFWRRGTWNTAHPFFLRAGIDHLLVPKDAQILKSETIVLKGSDHLAIYLEAQLPQ